MCRLTSYCIAVDTSTKSVHRTRVYTMLQETEHHNVVEVRDPWKAIVVMSVVAMVVVYRFF